MSDFFYSLEQDVSGFIYTVNQNVSKFNSQPSDIKEALIAETQQHLRETEKCFKQMEIETMPFSENVRKEMNQKIRKHRADYEEARRRFMKSEETYLDEKGKANLLGARFEDSSQQSRRPESLVETQNRKLEDAKKTGFGTLEIATSTTNELGRQTEVLLRNKDRLRQMDTEIGESNGLIKSMQRRVLRNKLTLYGVIAVIILAIILIVLSYF